MLERLDLCPICQNSTLGFYLEVEDYSISKEKFQLMKCSACDFVFTNPRPGSDEISKYYTSDDYISHSNTSKGLVNKLYQLIRTYSIRKKYSIIKKYSKGASILDIGCGTGAFLNYCIKKGLKGSGIEPSQVARQTAMDQYKIEISETFDALETKSFEVITLWHVLEHVHLLKEQIQRIKDLLAPNGLLLIAVPNRSSYDAIYYKEKWAALDVPRHLYHFLPKNVVDLFEKNNFKHLESLPMKFDSYYVSMLSEKYNGYNSFLINGLYRGLLSNLKAKGNAEKYSSVIYLFRKS